MISNRRAAVAVIAVVFAITAGPGWAQGLPPGIGAVGAGVSQMQTTPTPTPTLPTPTLTAPSLTPALQGVPQAPQVQQQAPVAVPTLAVPAQPAR